ncbi:deoxyribodipyrimidine photolyase [Ectothiorhodospira haloalkaliphila]|uniref:Deoxyribodipyrimidine photolyase n=1 Tax=Ectothiorhodospira haloalkaliphila TaxID=421628 RepID=W8L7T0_9GAMM|nr:cryptochrome/photolyase family protein [Ectothiorhodospira haloalkaliphila]AHK79905.1 deoxyribodipyrimidine photolyase [Ectothiorhodospira haloalkaliphila]
MTTLRLVLGDQLNASHPWFRQPDDGCVVVMMEIRSETDYVIHHAQKVLAIFAAMRRFAEALRAAGHRVHYLRIGDSENRQGFAANLQWLAAHYQATRFERMEADEWRVERLLDEASARLGLPSTVVDAAHFLCERGELAQAFSSERVPRLEYFYRDMRRRHGLLLDDHQKPVGGRWNFDADNRARWPGEPPTPDWPWAPTDVSALWQEIVAAGVRTLGEPGADALAWPLTRSQARAGLQAFIKQALPHFGRFQDAMSTREPLLFHSGLSFALNTKMLHPREVIDAALEAFEAGAVDIAACEGFVRQILGWREYVRGVYWSRMPDYAQTNALQARRPLPRWYWTGETHMACLRHAIGQSLRLAYAHHIQRLMITGNFALLAGCDPDAVDAWYLGIYIDAFEWVEMPNTRGMSQYADGGLVASKPYAASASYIKRQSDYCKGCRYAATRRHGDDACPFNALYWDFMLRHEADFASNPRMAMPYRAWKRMDEPERTATLEHAHRLLERLDTL